jgi:hypothetical protein
MLSAHSFLAMYAFHLNVEFDFIICLTGLGLHSENEFIHHEEN